MKERCGLMTGKLSTAWLVSIFCILFILSISVWIS
jgi:hypothetical protein